MQLKLNVSKKQGEPNYGSSGASAEIVVDLEPDFSLAMVSQVSTLWYQALTSAVDQQLAAMRPAAPAARPEPEPEYVPRRQREQNGEPAARPVRPIDPNRQRNDGGAWRGRPEVPEDGRQLLGWAKRNGRDQDLFSLGRAWKLPDRILDWDPADIADAYHALDVKPASNGRNGSY